MAVRRRNETVVVRDSQEFQVTGPGGQAVADGIALPGRTEEGDEQRKTAARESGGAETHGDASCGAELRSEAVSRVASGRFRHPDRPHTSRRRRGAWRRLKHSQKAKGSAAFIG